MKYSKTILTMVSIFFIGLSSVQAQIVDKAVDVSPLLIGEKIPKVELVDMTGEIIKLNSRLNEKPTILVLYRGGWCPYCNLHLSALAIAEQEILDLGYQIIAVSPENYINLQHTYEDDELKYTLYSDPQSKFIRKLGIAFRASNLTKKYMTHQSKSKPTEVLPVPSVFVVNTKGEIVFEYISPNYKQRLSPELLIAVLKNLDPE